MHPLILMMSRWRCRIAARRALAQIDSRALREAGIDPGVADYESAQPFWRPLLSLRDPLAGAPTPAPVANDCGPAVTVRPLRMVASSGK